MKKKTITFTTDDFKFSYLPQDEMQGGGKYRVLEVVKKLQPCIRPQIQKEANLSQSRTMHWLRILVKEGLIKRKMAIVHMKKTTVVAPVYSEVKK